ncbi:MAG: peptidoglycan DD-metalloendopeptidase family protein [Gemmiger sp.]
MSNFKAFLREKGLYLLCLALILAATVTSIWAVRSVVQNIADYTKSKQEAEQKEEALWDGPQTEANNPVEDVPKPTPTPSAPSSSQASSSGAQQASGSGQAGAGSAAAPSAQPATSGTASPVSGELSRPYSGDELVYNSTLGDWRTHNGADYACNAGDTVTACRTGVVRTAYTDALWGGVVELNDADGVTWRYCGLVSPAVAVGEEIRAGQPVGRAGTLPVEAADGTHVHVECRKGDAWLDPATLLN